MSSFVYNRSLGRLNVAELMLAHSSLWHTLSFHCMCTQPRIIDPQLVHTAAIIESASSSTVIICALAYLLP